MCKLYEFFLLCIDSICAEKAKIFSLPCLSLSDSNHNYKSCFHVQLQCVYLFKWSSRPNFRRHKEHSKGFFFSCTAAICLSKCSL